MIHHISEKENLENAVNTNFIPAIRELGISSLLGQCGIRKNSRRFITLLAARVVAFFDTLTCDNRFRALVIDDPVISRNRNKRVGLPAFIFDHVTGESVKGFDLLTIGWTDGYPFIPVAFNMLSSAKPAKRLNEMEGSLDKRTNGFKNCAAAAMKKPDAAVEMVRSVLNAGIPASYILMDTWSTNEPFIKNVLGVGLKQIAPDHIRFDTPGDISGPITVRTKEHRIPVKLVFVRNRNEHGGYIIILSTDCSLSDANYDTTVSSTALVFTRFIILEWLRRKQNDQKTVCGLFFVCCDDIRDIELSDALERLLAIFLDGMVAGTVKIEESVRQELPGWYISQPVSIQKLCCQSMGDAGIMLDNHISGEMSTVA